MKRTLISAVALFLLLISLPVFALSDVHPAQRGDQGGAMAAELESQLKKKHRRSGSGQVYYYPPQYPESNPSAFVPDLSGYPLPNWSESQGEETVLQNDFEADPQDMLPGTDGTSSQNGFGFQVDPKFVIPGANGPITDPSQIPAITGQEQAKPSSSSVQTGVQTLDWFSGGASLLNSNKSIKIYDTKTGTSWNAKYINGANHADVIPASQSDATLIKNKKITGSYERRPVVVTIAGTQYAGSMYAVGHGSTSYCSYFKGVMCIHFTGSKTHGTKKVDTAHQNAIAEALKVGGN